MDFNAEPYWDDFEATNGALEKNYMRILFRPGYAVQARELTQIQSILQNQIKQFGDHIFQDGSPVIGGHLTLDTGITYVKLEKQYNGVDIDLENFYGLTVFNSGTPKSRAKVVQTYSSTNDRTLLVRYLRGTGFSASQTISTAGGSSANTVSTGHTGTGSVVTINPGVFYVDGYFVSVPQQTIVLDPYSATPSYRIGLQINEEIVTESVDVALLDPAQESFNYQAPGAHRYQFALDLTKRTLDSIDDSRFFELLRVENGVITKQVSYPIYSELEKTLARRTYDESGNYAVRPFVVSVTANTPVGKVENTSSYIVNISPGKAYVKGFEYETIGTTKIPAERARTSKLNKDYDLSIYYGNRLQLANVVGSGNSGIVFNENLETVDIHCIPVGNVALDANTSKYYSSRIGTARIRNIDRSVDGNTYFAYLTDYDFDPITELSAGGEPNNRCVILNQHCPTYPNTYVNATVTLLTTAGAVGNSGRVISYNTSTRTMVVDTPFANTVSVNDRVAIVLPASAMKSIVIANTTTYNSTNLAANIAVQSIDARGNVFIEDVNYDKMIFPLPNYYVKYDSDVGVSLYRRHPYLNQSFTGNGAITITPTGTETFDFGTDASTVSNADVTENIIIVPRTGSNTGNIINMSETGRAVYRTSNQSISIYTNNSSGTSFTGDVYVTTKINNANGSFRRTKSLVQSNAAITQYDAVGAATSVVNYSEVKLNLSNNIVWFTSANVISATAGEPMPLFVSDVIRINKVYDSNNISYAPNSTNAIDITNRYVFDSGQNDSYYDHASIKLKPDAVPPRGQVCVLFDRFTHSGTGYLSAKSYPSSLYETESIPIYQSYSGKTYNLRDCIDLRPIRVDGTVADPHLLVAFSPKVNIAVGNTLVMSNTSLSSRKLTPPAVPGMTIKINNQFRKVDNCINGFAITVNTAWQAACTNGSAYMVTQNLQLTGGITPRPTDPMTLDYEYYLPRIDKVVVTKDKEFKVLTGSPSLVPQAPVEDENSMPIYTLTVPPYTAAIQSIGLNYIDNRRYTMKDISVIDNRVKILEKYVAMKESEKDTLANPPTYNPVVADPANPTPPLPQANVTKPIYAVVVDEFNDNGVADWTSYNGTAASIEEGLLSPLKVTEHFDLEPANKADPKLQDKFLTLYYPSETTALEQKWSTANGNTTVQAAVFGKFEGFVSLTPESDTFYSTVHPPAITNITGRLVELPIVSPTPPALFSNSTFLQSVGGGGYSSNNYTNTPIVGLNQDTLETLGIRIPDFSNSTSAEPNTTVTINLTQTAVMPNTTLNTIWTGGGLSVAQEEPFIYPTRWTIDGYKTSSLDSITNPFQKFLDV